jgi:hypothetical protein
MSIDLSKLQGVDAQLLQHLGNIELLKSDSVLLDAYTKATDTTNNDLAELTKVQAEVKKLDNPLYMSAMISKDLSADDIKRGKDFLKETASYERQVLMTKATSSAIAHGLGSLFRF